MHKIFNVCVLLKLHNGIHASNDCENEYKSWHPYSNDNKMVDTEYTNI